MAQLSSITGADQLEVGMEVDVRSRYVGSWCRGFAVAESLPGGVRVRRKSDGALFPDLFDPDDVRPETPARGW